MLLAAYRLFVGCAWRDVSPMDAYRIETARCDEKGGGEPTRQCQSMVDKKYQRYNSEGGYPARGYIQGERPEQR